MCCFLVSENQPHFDVAEMCICLLCYRDETSIRSAVGIETLFSKASVHNGPASEPSMESYLILHPEQNIRHATLQVQPDRFLPNSGCVEHGRNFNVAILQKLDTSVFFWQQQNCF